MCEHPHVNAVRSPQQQRGRKAIAKGLSGPQRLMKNSSGLHHQLHQYQNQ